MNRKSMTLAAVMFTGFLGAAPLDLSSYVTSGRKDTIKNTGLIVTNVDMVGMSAAITQYVGAAVTVNSVNGQTGTVTITASGLGALTAEADTLATVTARGNITSNTVAAFVTDTALSPFPGLYGSSVYGAGVEGHSISSRGVYGGTVGGYGMTAYAGGGGTGILALASLSGVGLFTPHSIISESTITANTFLGSGSALTGMTVSQIAGAYPASNPSNFVTAAQVSAADIRTPLVNVTTGATSTVTVTSAKRVYYVESDAQTTVTNDLSALALNCTSNAEWEVWYNATSTNALTPLWDSRMTFLGGNPEMTVTGVYKFALSSPCGTIIQARQTYPTVQKWAMCYTSKTCTTNPTAVTVSCSGTLQSYGGSISTTVGSSNVILYTSAQPILQPSVVRIYMHLPYQFNGCLIMGKKISSQFQTIQSYTFSRPINIPSPNLAPNYKDFVCEPSATAYPYAGGAGICICVVQTGTAAGQIIQVLERPMTELETAAYAAGWRP